MNGKRDWVSALALILALVGVLIFLGAYVVMGVTSVGGYIALGLSVVALIIYIYLRPQEVVSGLKSRQARYGGNTLLMSLIFIAILVAINFLSMRRYKRWDLTAEKQFSLAPESAEIVKSLTSPVTALNFSSSGSQSDTAVLLDQYKAASPLLEVKTIDPDAQPTLARQYLASDGMLVLLSGDRHVTVSAPTESEITAALIKVTRATQPVVYFTTGHGERDLEDGTDLGFAIAKAGLDRDGFQVKPLMLATTTTIPADAAVVIVGGPHAAFASGEVDMLRAYLTRGGRLMVMVDTSLDTRDSKLGDAGLGSLLSEWGITLRDDLVLDPVSSQVTDPGVTIAARYGSSPITQKLGNLATFFPGVRSIALATPAPANISYLSLVQTSDQSWGAADLQAVANGFSTGRFPALGAKDAKGPLTVAVQAENSQTKARLIVFGCSSFAINAMSRQPGNLDLFLNAANWLAEQESQITIRAKPFETRQLIPSVRMTIQVLGISVILMPLAVLVVGAIVWWKRR
jgi:gliding motility-associatede transport system auxiliary component